MKITHDKNKSAPLLILLLWLNPLIYFIKFNQLMPWQPDTMLLWATVITVALISAAITYWGNWVVRIIIIVITVTLTLSFVPTISHVLWLKLIGLVVLVGLLWITDNTITILTFMSIALVLSTVFLPVGQQMVHVKDQTNAKAPSPGQGPLILQIVLDEHIGPNGIPDNLPNGPAMQQFVKDFYLQHGFTLYENAYSRYPRTYDSIPNMLNFSANSQHTAYFPGGIHRLTLMQADAFTIAQKRGYQIRVFQANYINYCRVKNIAFGRCYTYPTHDLKQVYDMPLSLLAKNNIIFKNFLLNSSWYQVWINTYANTIAPFAERFGLRLPFWPWTISQISSPSAMQVFTPLMDDIAKNPKGVYIFAHLLLPHSPYIYTSDCQLVKNPDNWYTNFDDGPIGNSPERRKLRYHYYLQQMRCTYQPLGHLLTQLDQAGVLSNAYIIIQGDHGSRIAEHGVVMGNEPYVTWQDFTDSYDALFAERTPHSKPGIITNRLPITFLYGQWFSEAMGFPVPHDDTEPYVYLTVRNTNTRVNMTKFPLSRFKDAPTAAPASATTTTTSAP